MQYALFCIDFNSFLSNWCRSWLVLIVIFLSITITSKFNIILSQSVMVLLDKRNRISNFNIKFHISNIFTILVIHLLYIFPRLEPGIDQIFHSMSILFFNSSNNVQRTLLWTYFAYIS